VGSREAPVQLAAVEAEIRRLSTMFRLIRIRVEGWQGLSSVQTLSRLGLPVETFTPTVKTNADEWPVLAQRLSAPTLARQHSDPPEKHWGLATAATVPDGQFLR
jgi:hypothetical protein